jgi:hypothetical protein
VKRTGKSATKAAKPVVAAKPVSIAKWFWLVKNNPVTWQEYDSNVSALIEEGFVNKKKTIKIDEERIIDLDNMLQRRVDDSTRSRYVKRVGSIPVCSPFCENLQNSGKKRIDRGRKS